MRSLVAILLLAVSFSTPLSAAAQAEPSEDASLDVEARSLFEAGATAFAAGRYADALASFTRAYELSPRPELLYNIAQCEDRLRHDDAAIAAFERFLAETPDAPNAAVVRARVAILRDAASRGSAVPEPAPMEEGAPTERVGQVLELPSPTATAVDAPDDPAPWVLSALGAALAVGGVVMLTVSALDLASVEGAPEGTSFATVREAAERAPILSGLGWGALAVGVALTAGGLIWGLTRSGPVRVEVRASGSRLAIGGTF